MEIYQKILKGKVKFPRNFPKGAKSLVKHLLVADLTKRFGNLKGGAKDIKNHRFFKKMDFEALGVDPTLPGQTRTIAAPYKPPIK